MGQAKRRKQLDPNYGKTPPAYNDIKSLLSDLVDTKMAKKIADMVIKEIQDNKFAFINILKEETQCQFMNLPENCTDEEILFLNSIENQKVIYVIHSNRTKRRVLSLNTTEFINS
jgi:hypothetical protein